MSRRPRAAAWGQGRPRPVTRMRRRRRRAGSRRIARPGNQWL